MEMKFTLVRARRDTWTVEISSRQCGHLRGDSRVYSASKEGVEANSTGCATGTSREVVSTERTGVAPGGRFSVLEGVGDLQEELAVGGLEGLLLAELAVVAVARIDDGLPVELVGEQE